MKGLTCRMISALPPDAPLTGVLRRHRSSCPRCRTEAVESSGLAQELAGMGEETVSAPEGLASGVMIRLGAQDGADPRRPLLVRVALRWGAVGLVAVATLVALIAGLWSRLRRGATGS